MGTYKYDSTKDSLELIAGKTKDSGSSEEYTLPIASADTLGGVKIGENLSIAADGTLSVAGGSGGSGSGTMEGLTEDQMNDLNSFI